MSTTNLAGLVIAAVITVFLVIALVFPERF